MPSPSLCNEINFLQDFAGFCRILQDFAGFCRKRQSNNLAAIKITNLAQ